MKVAIDGPAGAGKSTVAKELAKIFGLSYVDTGAMYRAIALKVIKMGFSDKTIDGFIDRFLYETQITILDSELILDGKIVTNEIRNEDVSKLTSILSSNKVIRDFVSDLQILIARNGNVVMDGRDIGTVIMPDADYKFFITASIDKRALRRHCEFIIKGIDITIEKIREGIEIRDKNDMTREISPLVKATDAVEIDTTDLDVEETVSKVVEYMRRHS